MGIEQKNSQYSGLENDNNSPKMIAELLPVDIPGIQPKNLRLLQEIDRRIVESGLEGGMLSILTTTEKSLRVLEKELGIGRHVLAKIYDFYGIPRLSQAEASVKAFSEARKNPEAAERMARSASETMKRQLNNPEFQEKRISASRNALRKPEARAKRSAIAKNMWQNRTAEERESISHKASEDATRRWQDPEFREKTVQAIREAARRRIYTPEVLERLSQKAKEQWEDPEARKKIMDARKEIENDPIRREALREQRRRHFAEIKSDPAFQQKLKEGRSHMYDGEKGEILRQKRRDQMSTPEAQQRNREIMQRLHVDPEFQDKQLEALMEVLADEEFQQRRLAGLKKKWGDPEFRAKKSSQMSELTTRLNSDPEHLSKAAQGIRKLRAKPESAERFALPTIQGYRRDIGNFVQSAWEANIARVLMLQGKQFYSKESFMLEVDPKFQDLFKFRIAQYTVDFIVEDDDGNLIAYEILAHPQEDPVGVAKAEMFAHQYPDLRIHVIDGKEYEGLKRQYSEAINDSPDFCGWETSRDNLRNNPEKYGK